jgi:hypothetical protein
MTTAMTKRLARAVLIAGLALPATTLLPVNAPFATTQAHAAGPTTVAEFKSVLASYGKWGTHDKYGDIWVPTVTPPGWHPYPACQWVDTKQGWYFNDNTPWGSIVHHYGRWSHDEQIGWFWVPDQEWSPGWVVWRKSDQWIGWAPMPPEQDYQLVSSAEFNNDKLWIFMAAAKFLKGGCGDTVQASQAFYLTQPTNWFGLPTGTLVDIDIDQHWTVKNIIKIIKVDIDIDIDIDINYCPPTQPNPPNIPRSIKSSPIHFDPPKDRRSSNDPGPGSDPTPPVRGRDPVLTPPVNIDKGGSNNPALVLPSHPVRGITIGGGQDGGGKIGRGDGGRTDGGKNGRGDGGKSAGGNGGKISRGVGKIKRIGDDEEVGKISRGDGGGSDWKRPHLSLLNSYGHSTLGNANPVRTPSMAVGTRLNAIR